MSDVEKTVQKIRHFIKEHGDAFTLKESAKRICCSRVTVESFMRRGEIRHMHCFRTPLLSKVDVETQRQRMKQKRAGRNGS